MHQHILQHLRCFLSNVLLTYRSAGLRVISKEQASLKVVKRMQEILSENNETLAALRNILEANMIEHVKKLNNTTKYLICICILVGI